MERQHSALTAVSPLSAHAVGELTGDSELNADKPGDRLVLDEDTFIIQEDGGIIPVLAGTVATLLPDSEDETTEIKPPVVLNRSESTPEKNSQSAVPDKSSDLNCQAKLSAVESLKTDSSCPSEIPVTIDNPSVLNENSTEDVLCSESAEVDAVDESSTIPLPENGPNNSTVQGELLSCLANVSAPGSDLNVQEEEEVILDQSAADVCTSELSSVETQSVLVTCNSEEPAQIKASKKSAPKDSFKQSEASHLEKSKKSESPALQTQPKYSVSNTPHEKNTVVTVTPAVSASGRPQRSTPRRSAIDLLKGSDVVKPVRRAPTEHDLDGPPAKIPKQVLSKKNTDSSVSIEEKASTDATVSRGRPRRKVADATAMEAVDDGQALKKSKSSFTEESSCDSAGTFNSDAIENGKLKLLPSTSALNDVSAETDVILGIEKDNIVAPKVAGENQVAELVSAVNSPVKEITSTDPSRSRGHPRRKVSDAEGFPIVAAQAENLNCSDKCESVKSGKQKGSETSALSDSLYAETGFDDEIRKKIEVENNKTKGQSLSKECSNSPVRGPSKKSDDLKLNQLNITANGSNKEEQDNGDSVEALSAQRCLRRKPIVQNDLKSSKTKVAVAVHENPDGLSDEKEELDTAEDDLKQRIGNSKESETGKLQDNSGLPGFPYHAFTKSSPIKNIAEVKSRIKSAKIRHQKDKLVNQIGVGRETHSDVLEVSRAKFPNVESMQARIRELEAKVDELQLMLREGKPENGGSAGKSSGYGIQKDSVVSQDLSLDLKSALDRKETKLRHLDRELDDKRTELTVKLACIIRYERQVLEKERRLKKLEVSLNLRKQPFQCLEDSAKDTSSIKETPLLMTGRVDLHAEEHKLELRRQELERQSTFLEDEKKKLVAKERELETREQAAEHAAVDADLISMASVFKSSEQTGSSVVKHSNGKISVEFSDDEDDSFGLDSRRFDKAFAKIVGFPAPVALPGESSFTDDDGEAMPIQISSAKKKYSDYTEDISNGANSSNDSSVSESFVKRRCVDTEENSVKQNRML